MMALAVRGGITTLNVPQGSGLGSTPLSFLRYHMNVRTYIHILCKSWIAWWGYILLIIHFILYYISSPARQWAQQSPSSLLFNSKHSKCAQRNQSTFCCDTQDMKQNLSGWKNACRDSCSDSAFVDSAEDQSRTAVDAKAEHWTAVEQRRSE